MHLLPTVYRKVLATCAREKRNEILTRNDGRFVLATQKDDGCTEFTWSFTADSFDSRINFFGKELNG